MSSHSLHASCPSTFRAPEWGALASLSSCCRWRNATSQKLVPFSHRSASRIFIRQPGCIPSPVVTQDGDHQLDGGEKRAGLRPLPLPQPQGFSSPGLGRGVRRVEVGPCVGGGPLLHSVIGGKGGRRPWRWQLVTARRSSAFRRSAGLPPRSGVVRTCGGGTGVPFVMALRMPVFFVHCGCRGLNVYVISARSRVFSSFSSTKSRLLIIRTALPSMSRPVSR